jgi:hypothetical protein
MPEETNGAPAPSSTSAPAGGKKSNSTTIIIIVVVVVVILGVGGYLLQNYLARKTAESILSSTTGSAVSVSDNGVSVSSGSATVATGDKATWPSTMPSDVPKFGSGNILGVTTDTTTGYWTVTYENCTDSAAGTKYVAALIAAGWTQTATYDANNSIVRSMEKGQYILNLTFSSQDKGANITVQKETVYPE